MGNIWSAEKMLAIALPAGFNKSKKECIEQAEKTSVEIFSRFPKCRQVANTFRFDERAELIYYATLYKTINFTYQKNIAQRLS